MNASLTPFLRHELEHRPGPSGPPEAAGSRCSPPLGKEPSLPPGDPTGPGTQLPPPELPGATPHPGPGSSPQAKVPVTDGTPVACRQKNAQAFLHGEVQTSVMAHYAPGLFSTQQHTYSAHPAPEEDQEAVERLVEWRENAPYG